MIFRRWMIVACVAVAAAMGSAVAEAQYSYTSVEVRVLNKAASKVVATVCKNNLLSSALYECAAETVAPYSATTVTLPVDPAEQEDCRIVVKVKNRPTRVLTIKREVVLKLMQKSGFTSGVHPTVSAVVDKYGNVTFGGVYLKKDVAP